MSPFHIFITFLVITIIGLDAYSSAVDERKADQAETIPQKMDGVQKLPSLNILDANDNKINLASFQGKKGVHQSVGNLGVHHAGGKYHLLKSFTMR